jgi:hypothetical protein
MREAATVVYQFRIGSFAQEKQTWATVHPKRLCTFFGHCAQRKRFPQPGVKCERSRRLTEAKSGTWNYQCKQFSSLLTSGTFFDN